MKEKETIKGEIKNYKIVKESKNWFLKREKEATGGWPKWFSG